MKSFNLKIQLVACLSILLVCTVYASCVHVNTQTNNEVSEEQKLKMLPYRIISDTLNTNYSTNEAKIRFLIDRNYLATYEESRVLKTAVNGVWKDKNIDEQSGFEYMIEPGNYQFHFFMDSSLVEINIPNIVVKAQHDLTVRLSFYRIKSSDYNQIRLEKPVVYVYSDEDVPLEIGIQPKGELAFTYPQTTGKWKGTATKNGFDIAGKHYPYLFWEANMNLSRQMKWENTSIIRKDQVLTYLEKVCEKVGLNDNERTDLITYWGPRMMTYEYVEVLALTEDIDRLFGELTTSDQSFEIERFYIIFRKSNKQDERWNLEQLKSFKRSPKFILEWGGGDVVNMDV